jgi:hypothetical protein
LQIVEGLTKMQIQPIEVVIEEVIPAICHGGKLGFKVKAVIQNQPLYFWMPRYRHKLAVTQEYYKQILPEAVFLNLISKPEREIAARLTMMRGIGIMDAVQIVLDSKKQGEQLVD